MRAGLLGELLSVHCGVHWDHTWTVGTPFENIFDLIFYDYAIHWFDFISSILPESRPPLWVSATRSRAMGQTARPPMLAQAAIQFEGGQASLVFDACLPHGSLGWTYVGGTQGSVHCTGPDIDRQTLKLSTSDGSVTPNLEGCWFPSGFHGTMAELLSAIEDGREPENSARGNLRGLALCFAAIASANDGGAPKAPYSVRGLPPGSAPVTPTQTEAK